MSTTTLNGARTAPAPRDGQGQGGAGRSRAAGTMVAPPRTGTGPAPVTIPASGGAARSRPARPAPATEPQAEGASGVAPFVLLIMVLLTGGLIVTLWLSTAAAADSYRLQESRDAARELSERSERLYRDVEAARSSPALATAARNQGLVPAGEPAVLLVAPDGSTQIVGDPRPAPSPPAPPPPPMPEVPPSGPAVPGAAVSDPAAPDPAAAGAPAAGADGAAPVLPDAAEAPGGDEALRAVGPTPAGGAG